MSKCIVCFDGFYLNFKAYQENYCEKCEENLLCKKCIILNNKEVIDYNEKFFNDIKSLNEFQEIKIKFNLTIFCVACKNEGFAIDLAGKCNKCSNKISKCDKCSFSNTITNNFSRFILENHEKNIFPDLNQFNDLILKCSKCLSTYFPLKPSFDICVACPK